MYQLVYTNQFKKDVKRLQKRGWLEPEPILIYSNNLGAAPIADILRPTLPHLLTPLLPPILTSSPPHILTSSLPQLFNSFFPRLDTSQLVVNQNDTQKVVGFFNRFRPFPM